jgi:membrane protein required for colicin V production
MDFDFKWFDFAAMAILGLSGVMGFARGLIREVFTVIAFIAGILAALFLIITGTLQPLVEQVTPLRGVVAMLAGGLGVFLLVFIAITLVTSQLAKSVHQSTEVGNFDRSAGLAFGILRGILVVAVLFVLPLRLLPPSPSTDLFQKDVTEAVTFPIYRATTDAMVALWPPARERLDDILKQHPIPPADGTSEAAAPIPDAGSGEPAPDNPPAKQN